MMFNKLLQSSCWRMSLALIWSLDIFSLILLRFVFSASVLPFLMLFSISEILSVMGLHFVFWLMMWFTISPVSNHDALYSASVLRWSIVRCHTFITSSKNDQIFDLLAPTIRKNEQWIYYLKTIESAKAWQISGPSPHPLSMWTS